MTTKASPDDANALGANLATEDYGVTGAGIKIGIISDSFNVLGGESADIAAGNLPASGVTVLEEGPSGSSDEGRAMAQLIYQIAPGASLDFASGDNGMVDAVDSLVAAGCNIIVDDLSYLEQPFFQEGSPIETAVSAAVNDGVDYFTAAGNYGSNYYQAAFTPIKATLPHVHGTVVAENFGGGETLQPVSVPSGQNIQLVLEWDQPFASIGTAGGSDDSLAIYVYNAAGNIVASSTTDQVGSDPIQYIDTPSNATGQTQTYDIAIVDTNGTVPGLFKYIIFDDSSPSDVIDDPNAGKGSGTSVGQETNTDVNTVGAVAYYDTPTYGVVVPTLESFSATGSTDIVLSATGRTLATPIQVSVPDFTATDGAVTSVLDPFYGTSAAVANAAAVGALVLQANTLLSTEDLTALLKDSAIAMAGTGGGAGLIQANVAVGFAESGTIAGFASGDTILYGTHLGNTIIGSTGNDTFVVGAGNNTIEGGAGINTVDYASQTGAVDVNLASGIAENGSGGTDLLSNIQNVIGSDFRDTITFGSGLETFEIQLASDMLDDTLQGISTSDTLQLLGATFNNVSFTNGTLLALEGSFEVAQFDLAAAASGDHFAVAANSAGDIITTACYALGTRIQTPTGERAIETLGIGDHVLTAGGEAKPVRWIGYQRIDIARHPDPISVAPVRVLAGAFGTGLPHRDLLLSPDHAIFAHEKLVPIKLLINGATVVQEWPADIFYFHLELPCHSIIRAEGLPAETFLDTGNRGGFANGGAYAGAGVTAESRDCGFAPVITGGAALAELRAALVARAEERGFRLTDDPDLHLLADGVYCPRHIEAGKYRFGLPAGAGAVVLRSRPAVPTWTDPGCADARRLGVVVTALAADGVAVDLDDSALAEGFHPVERSGGAAWRWTDGDAVLNLPGVRSLQVATHPGRRYVQPVVSDCSLTVCGNPVREGAEGVGWSVSVRTRQTPPARISLGRKRAL